MTRFLRSLFLVICLSGLLFGSVAPAVRAQDDTCTGEFISVSEPLNDLGADEYVRLDEGPTGFYGGLYPNGSNTRPPAHDAAGIAIANQVVPLDANGNPDPATGEIAMISVGMSNAAAEFITFIDLVENDPAVNPQLVLVNGAQPGETSDEWVDPNAPTWQYVDQRLANAGLTPAQVQVAWVKNVRAGSGDFPAKAQQIQGDLEAIAQNLLTNYPNIKLAYYSSRTRSYTYWIGLSPEPVAFETGFSVKWLVEAQINGDPDLNYDPDNGPVVAPFLSWGAYLWADGINPRSDGFVWLPEDMVPDCTHPSDSGRAKVANLLLDFFKTDATTAPWFLADDGVTPTVTATAPGTATSTTTPTVTATQPPAGTATPTGTATTTSTPAPAATGTPSPTPTIEPEATRYVYLPVISRTSSTAPVPGTVVPSVPIPNVGVWLADNTGFVAVGMTLLAGLGVALFLRRRRTVANN